MQDRMTTAQLTELDVTPNTLLSN